MSPVFHAAKQAPKRVVYAEGEEERVLRAVQIVVDEGLARPILIGRPEVIEARIERSACASRRGKDFEIVEPGERPALPRVLERVPQADGPPRRHARSRQAEHVRQFPTLIGAMLIRRGDADAMLCGIIGRYEDHLSTWRTCIGRERGREACSPR